MYSLLKPTFPTTFLLEAQLSIDYLHVYQLSFVGISFSVTDMHIE